MPLSAQRYRLAASLSPPVELNVVVIVCFAASISSVVIRHILLPFIPPTEPFIVLNAAHAVTYVGGVVVAALVYVRSRNLSVDAGHPYHVTAGVASILTPLAVIAIGILARAIFGIDVVSELFSSNRFAPVVPDWYIIVSAASNAAWFAAGYALIVCGVAYETIRRRVSLSDRDALVLTAAVIVILRFFPVSVETITQLSVGSLSSIVPRQFALIAFGIVAACCIAAAVGVIYRAVDAGDVMIAVSPLFVPVYAVAAVGLFVLVVDPYTPIEELFYVVAFTSAAAGYARTKSIWTAVTALFAFEFIVQVAPVV
ncbi:hypothetical protein [Halalkalirubrum salinum]|uniref:hypothetical protein n=1 Tax=Halalkalirubrum salinum TaxID=2563889 RepID=UPI0010FB3474|nr:hypothetical protein [Halalkalirubrum salinum]